MILSCLTGQNRHNAVMVCRPLRFSPLLPVLLLAACSSGGGSGFSPEAIAARRAALGQGSAVVASGASAGPSAAESSPNPASIESVPADPAPRSTSTGAAASENAAAPPAVRTSAGEASDFVQEEPVVQVESPRRRGFFGRLFGRGDRGEAVVDAASPAEPAVVEESTSVTPAAVKPDPAIADSATVEESTVAEAAPRKRGFFRRLFGRDEATEPAGTPQSVADAVANPGAAETAPETASATDSPVEELEQQPPTPRKRGFFARLFGRDKEPDTADFQRDAEEREALAALDNLEAQSDFTAPAAAPARAANDGPASSWRARAASSRAQSGMADPDSSSVPDSADDAAPSLDRAAADESSVAADAAALLAEETQRRAAAARGDGSGSSASATASPRDAAAATAPTATARPAAEGPSDDGSVRVPKPQLPGREAFVDDSTIATPDAPLRGIQLPDASE